LAVHPTLSIVLTGSDDMTIKAWDWDKQWKNIRVRRPSKRATGLLLIIGRSSKGIHTTS
jgi:WD40 repeat protein